MKKYLPISTVALLPYFPIVYFFYYVAHEQTPVGPMANISLVWCALSLLISVVYAILAIRKEFPAHELALVSMIVKAVQIPAYILIFITGIIYLLSLVMSFAIIFLWIYDLFLIICSGILGAAAAVRCHREGTISKAMMLILAIMQFVFCLDVVFAVILYVRTKIRKPATK